MIVAICGCGNFSGGGSIHIPPNTIVADVQSSLKLELIATGTLSGPLDTRYTKLICHYTFDDGSQSETVMGTPKNVTNKRMDVEFLLPPIEASHGYKLKYWFTFDFDDVPNRRDGGLVPIEPR